MTTWYSDNSVQRQLGKRRIRYNDNLVDKQHGTKISYYNGI